MLVRVIGGHGGVSPGFRATSYLIDGKLLIDAGSVASGIQINEQAMIENILISHSHLDHISDLAFLADNCFGMKGNPFEVYTSHKIKENIMNHLFNDAIWPDFSKLPSANTPTMRFHDIKEQEELSVGDYKVTPVHVNHQEGAFGFIVEKGDCAIVFTQDTGPTDKIWEVAKTKKNIKAIFTEVSFPNNLVQVAIDSQHHTPSTMSHEVEKMPDGVPIFLGHLKPNFQDVLIKEISDIGNERINVLSSDDTSYMF